MSIITPVQPSAFHIPRILCIEAHPLIQTMTQSMIQVLGAHCVGTSHCNEALELFQQDYDLVLLDLRLPSISGFELAERMRAIETDGKRTPIIGHSTVANPEEVEPLCLAAGMDALCAKLTCLYDMHDLFRQWLNCPLVMPVFLVDVHVPSTVAI